MDETAADRAAGERLLADVSEEELLEAILPFFAGGSGDLVGPGDDAAVVATPAGSVVATTDAVVRDRDWRDDWSSAADVGVKAVTQNLADLAAMGAVPVTLLLTLVADPQTPLAWVVELAESVAGAARGAGASVVGGDLSSAPTGTLVLSVTALGDLEGRSPVLRSGARVGDVVAVAGSLGRSGAGLRLLERGVTAPPTDGTAGLVADVLGQHRRPRAPLAAGPTAARAGATAMIDLSDGLVRDAGRVARSSGVRVDLDSRLLAPDVERLLPVLPAAEARACVLGGGEEHSLLASFPGPGLPPGWRPVGRTSAGSGVALDGEPLAPAGWDHFAG